MANPTGYGADGREYWPNVDVSTEHGMLDSRREAGIS